MCIFCLLVCLCTTCVPAACGGQKEGIRSTGPEVSDGCEPTHGCWDLSPLEEQPVRLSTEPMLKPSSAPFLCAGSTQGATNGEESRSNL